MFQEFEGEDFQAFFVVHEDTSFQPASAAVCARVRASNGLSAATVLHDEGGLLDRMRLGSRHVHRVFGPGSVLEFTDAFRDDRFSDQIRALLAR